MELAKVRRLIEENFQTDKEIIVNDKSSYEFALSRLKEIKEIQDFFAVYDDQGDVFVKSSILSSKVILNASYNFVKHLVSQYEENVAWIKKEDEVHRQSVAASRKIIDDHNQKIKDDFTTREKKRQEDELFEREKLKVQRSGTSGEEHPPTVPTDVKFEPEPFVDPGPVKRKRGRPRKVKINV